MSDLILPDSNSPIFYKVKKINKKNMGYWQEVPPFIVISPSATDVVINVSTFGTTFVIQKNVNFKNEFIFLLFYTVL